MSYWSKPSLWHIILSLDLEVRGYGSVILWFRMKGHSGHSPKVSGPCEGLSPLWTMVPSSLATDVSTSTAHTLGEGSGLTPVPVPVSSVLRVPGSVCCDPVTRLVWESTCVTLPRTEFRYGTSAGLSCLFHTGVCDLYDVRSAPTPHGAAETKTTVRWGLDLDDWERHTWACLGEWDMSDVSTGVDVPPGLLVMPGKVDFVSHPSTVYGFGCSLRFWETCVVWLRDFDPVPGPKPFRLSP